MPRYNRLRRKELAAALWLPAALLLQTAAGPAGWTPGDLRSGRPDRDWLDRFRAPRPSKAAAVIGTVSLSFANALSV